jgi:hypothetical protein
MSIKSKSKAVRGARSPLPQSATVESANAEHIATETASRRTSLPFDAQRQRVEQMYRLANIFASIFEALRTAGDTGA